jgi:hypothetical protein
VLLDVLFGEGVRKLIDVDLVVGETVFENYGGFPDSYLFLKEVLFVLNRCFGIGVILVVFL